MKGLGKLTVVALAVPVLFVLGGLGLLVSNASDRPAVPVVPAGAAEAAFRPGNGTVVDLISQLQARLRLNPQDARSFASLGIAYVQRARMDADPTFYPKAQGTLRRSLSLDPGENFDADVGMGTLTAARHNFSGALRWGERAVKLDPANGDVYGVIGDAQVELGRYAAAFRTFQTMVDTKPNVSSYARVSYARELQGDVAGAMRAMRAALRAAGTDPDRAWTEYQIGELDWNRGDVAGAARAYRRAEQFDPTYVPPLAGLAKVAWARGDVSDAIARYRDVVQRYPSSDYVTALGEAYQRAGRPALARRQFGLVRTIQRLFHANGVDVDLEFSLYESDHGEPGPALHAAREEWGRRHAVNVADALAWALHVNGRDRGAERYSQRALHLGTHNALFEYHAGMIQLGLGNRDAARRLLSQALATNPNFSIVQAPIAMQTLARLGGRA